MVYFIGKITILCQDGGKGELVNFVEVGAGNGEGWGYGGLCR